MAATPARDIYGGMDQGILRAIGLAMVNFSQVEEALRFAVSCLIGGTRPDDVTEVILRKLAFRNLIDMFGGLYRHRFGSADDDVMKAFCNELEKLNERRNDLVHSFWVPGKSSSELVRYYRVLRRRGMMTSDVTVNEGDVVKFALEADDLYGRVLNFAAGTILQKVDDVLPKRL